ncbi:MAG: adenylate/guanylate cyclase domain-containing protein [Actinomycetota bacterium]|nr:adenylate/guanylate cyclase domain-containing protein [Actinomycetota bacterium]
MVYKIRVGMNQLPEGIVTFVLTDVEGSTRLWEDAPKVMLEALYLHDETVDAAVAAHNGVSVKPRGEGDSRFLVFNSAFDALATIVEIQKQMAQIDWPTPRPLKIRAALHTGWADLSSGDYYGSTINRAARLRAIAHGGQTLISRATWELLADSLPDGVVIEDIGEHRLKDLTRPEQVFQVHVPGLPNSFPPLTSLRTIPNNLPEQLTEFVGRERELVEAKRLLGETRLLTILGPGGAGKTRLAIQAAADLADHYPDGVFFIALADIRSSDEIVQSVAEALELGLSADQDVQVQLLNYLATKRQLLVFDNFEHVQDGASIVAAILKQAPRVQVLATSRSKLNLTGETVMPLLGLDITWNSAKEASRTSGVRLFVAAATRANPGFSLDGDDLEPLARILELTDGMPLAILLAAAWVDILSVREIAAEIAKSLDFLQTEMGDVPDRHRNVRAVYDSSWALLGEEERETFVRLSVFRGGFSREAAEEVAGASLRSLATLAGKSMVTPSPDRGRYSVHELLRQYAEKELERDGEKWGLALDSHAAYYASFMEEIAGLVRKSDQPRMACVVEDDLDNVRAAWRHFLHTENGEGGRKLVFGLYHVYEWRGWYASAVALFGEAITALDADSDDEDIVRLRAMSQAVQGWFLSLLGQPEVGAAAAIEARATLPASTDVADQWVAHQCVAIGLSYLGLIDDLVEVTDHGIELTSPMADPFYAAALGNWRSFAALLAGDLEKAAQLLPVGMAVFEERDEHYFMTWNLWLQALIATAEGRPVDAIELYTRQVARSEELGYLRGKVVAFEGLGDANVAADRLVDAETAYVRSLTTADQMGMAPDMLGLMAKIGRVWSARGLKQEAVELLTTVWAEPISRQQTFADSVPIGEVATEALAELEAELEPALYSEARRRGAARQWDEAAKELMDSVA